MKTYGITSIIFADTAFAKAKEDLLRDHLSGKKEWLKLDTTYSDDGLYAGKEIVKEHCRELNEFAKEDDGDIIKTRYFVFPVCRVSGTKAKYDFPASLVRKLTQH